MISTIIDQTSQVLISINLYKKEGKDAQVIAGHVSEQMTKNYVKGHEDIVWSDAKPDLDISNFIK